MNELFFQGDIGIRNTTQLQLVDVNEIVDAIKTGKFRGFDLKRKIEAIRNHDPSDEKGIKELKESLPYILSSAQVAQANVANEPKHHTGVIQLDFDLKEFHDVESRMEQAEKIKALLILDPLVLMAFVSPSGGLKILCKTKEDIQNHDRILESLVRYFYEKCGLQHDPNCKGIKRAMYLSFDCKIYYNQSCSTFTDYKIDEKQLDDEPSASKLLDPLELQKIDAIVSQVVDQKLDFAPSHGDFVKVGFSLCSIGEQGRIRFHLVCQFSPKYNSKDCDKQFDQCLKGYSGKIGLGTFYHYAKKYGLTFLKDNQADEGNETQSSIVDEEEAELNKLDQILSETSTLPDSVFENLPDFIRSASALFTEHRVRDLFLTSLLTVLSSLFPLTYGIYDNAKVYPNLFTFIIGPPASGKSVVRWALKCLQRVSKYLASLNEREIVDPSNQNEKQIPVTNLIPGNISIAGLIQLLSNNPVALMFETEADAVSKLFNVSFGDYSDKLRQIAHHEPIYSYRKIGKEYITIDEPKMSLLVTGTPSQIESLVRGSADGLFSRMIYYSYSGRPNFRSPFNSPLSFSSIFVGLAGDIFEVYKSFNEMDCEIKFTESQIKKFDKVMECWQTLAFDHHQNTGVSVVNRMGLIMFRIAMVLTILRQRKPAPELFCSDQDFTTALSICEVLRIHSFTVLRVIPKQPVLKPDENKVMTEFLKALPHEFKYSEAVALSHSFGISPRQAKRYVRELTKSGKLRDGVPKKGFYKKN